MLRGHVWKKRQNIFFLKIFCVTIIWKAWYNDKICILENLNVLQSLILEMHKENMNFQKDYITCSKGIWKLIRRGSPFDQRPFSMQLHQYQPIQKNHHIFWTNDAILYILWALKCPKPEQHSLFYDCLSSAAP